ncbi:MAG: DUF6384 family protein [Pseudomonadota bacterium]|nr:DUF6384 family protein [Pseudomonadota bacterium]
MNSSNLPATTDTAPVPTPVPLDEVMLAMDIVDTLRHERSTVERELDAETRDEVLIERIKGIYAGQGIAVTDDLIRNGVEALKQDRFAYLPPKPSFALRLAQVYIERWKWFRRSAITSVLLGAGFVAWQLPQQWQERRAYSTYTQRFVEVGERVGKLDVRIERLTRWHDAQSAAEEPVRAPIGRIVDDIDTALRRVRSQRAKLSTLSAADSDDFAAQKLASTAVVESSAAELVEIETSLHSLETKSAVADQLAGLATRFLAATTVLAGAALNASDQANVTNVSQQAAAALRAGDAVLGEASVRRLDQIAAQLSQVYQLRIVSQSGVKSGVWRYPVDNPKGRNYYLVVEAIGESGLPLNLPITNEETQKIEDVSRFAVRVPESGYESVKADKLDNGLIDNALVGIKRRGELDVVFKIPVAGGYITQWEE